MPIVRDLGLSPSLLTLSPRALLRQETEARQTPASTWALVSLPRQSIRPHRLIECPHRRTDSQALGAAPGR